MKNWGRVRIFKQILSREFCRVLLWRGVADSQLQKFWPSECWRLGSAFHLSWWGRGGVGALAVSQGQENIFPAELSFSVLRSAAWPAHASALQLIVKTPAISKVILSRYLFRHTVLFWLSQIRAQSCPLFTSHVQLTVGSTVFTWTGFPIDPVKPAWELEEAHSLHLQWGFYWIIVTVNTSIKLF